MGADFVFSMCPLPSYLNEGVKEEISYRIKNLPLQNVIMFLDRFHYNFEEEVESRINGDFLTEDDLFNIDTLKEKFMRDIVSEMLDEALDEVIYSVDFRRDTATIDLSGKRYVISGGMSWGDNPTEAMSYIEMLEESGILEGLNQIS